MRWQTQERYLRNYLANLLEIPLVGQIHFALPAGSSTSLYEEWFRTEMDVPAELISTGALAPSQAFGNCSANRNDVVLVAPGAYVHVAEIAWNKAQTHMIGMGGPNVAGDYSEPGAAIYSTTTTVANILNITGANCQFHNIIANNAGANASCLSAIKLANYGCRFKNVHMAGCMAATQAATALACSLWIRGAGMYPVFENCIIGHDVWTTRTGANQGVILFNQANTQTNGGKFKNCDILSVCETATGAFVAVVGNNVLGRGWIFENCNFNNYTTGTTMNQAFYESASNSISDRQVLLNNCTLNGCDAWQDSNYATILSAMPVANAGGGNAIEVSE